MDKMDLRIPRQAAIVRLQVEDRLRAAIAGGLFKPGQRLIERELCEQIGVGRTSIREALRQLEAEQLVMTIPHKGPVVRVISVEEARELYEARALLEGYAGRMLAQNATADDIGRLKEVLDLVVATAQSDDRAGLIQAKARFYAILMSGCRNSQLLEMLKRLNDRISLLRVTSMASSGRISQSVEEIKDIYAAVASRDPDRAERACKYHIEQASLSAMKVLANRKE